MNSNTNAWYQQLPDKTSFVLYLVVVGTIYRIDGFKANNQFGAMQIMSYGGSSVHATAERKLYNSVWSKWDIFVLNSDFGAIDEDQSDYTNWAKSKYNSLPDQSLKMIYNSRGQEALYIFCKNNSTWGMVLRMQRSEAAAVFRKLILDNGIWGKWV